jgi:hypothetical protein
MFRVAARNHEAGDQKIVPEEASRNFTNDGE